MTFKEILDRAVSEVDPYSTGIPALIEETEELDGAEEIEDQVWTERRWSSIHRAVFKHEDRFWAVQYDRPATENQEWSTEGYQCYEVQQVKKTVFDYVPIPKAGL